jgi:uncharacterized cofD-like protein
MRTDKKQTTVTAVGGGTGLSILLRGLKRYTTDITAIVSVTDNGGSSGRLRENLDMLPPGDIRNCLLALAEAEPVLKQVFQHRFASGKGLRGHTLGNLFLAALTEEFGFEGALAAASRVLAVTGRVMPVTLNKLTLAALLDNGREVLGESEITAERGNILRLRLVPGNAEIYPAANQAILNADIVAVGPGSLYTSILANLLVPGMTDALRRSRVRKVYICNVMTQPGETEDYTASDHLKAIYSHVGPGLFDTVLVNTNLEMPADLRARYALEGRRPVTPDTGILPRLGVEVIAADLLAPGEYARHDPDRLARILLGIRSHRKLIGE